MYGHVAAARGAHFMSWLPVGTPYTVGYAQISEKNLVYKSKIIDAHARKVI